MEEISHKYLWPNFQITNAGNEEEWLRQTLLRFKEEVEGEMMKKVIERLEFEAKGYNIAAEQADTVYQKGVELEGYPLAQALDDANRNTHRAET